MKIKNNKASENTEYVCNQLKLKTFTEIESFPLYVQIETLAKCNSRCIMCPRSIKPPIRRNFEMTDYLFDKIVKELKQHAGHLRRVVPQGYGEPLLDPKLPLRIAQLKEANIREVFISTNAALLTREKSEALLASGLDQVDISIDAFRKETYENIRKGLHYETVVENIQAFIEIRDKKNAKTRVRFRYVIQQDNAIEYDEFCAFWKVYLSKGDVISGKMMHTFGGHIEMPGSAEYLRLQKKLRSLPCKGIYGSFCIFCDGTVPICGVDVNQDYLAGDLNQSSIKEVWKGHLFAEFRRRQLELGREAYSHCWGCNSWAPELKLMDVKKNDKGRLNEKIK